MGEPPLDIAVQRSASAPRERNDASLFFGLDSVPHQRARVLEAMTRAVAHKGYARTTVSDVVALAGVSRRTFYEHFANKEECFLAAYAAGSEAVIRAVAAAVESSGATEWRNRLRIGLETYTAVLAANPDSAQALLVDVLGAGPRAVQLRREVLATFVDLFRPSADGTEPYEDAMRRVPDSFLRALVGGISELVQEHILRHGPETLQELTPTLVDLAVSIVEVRAQAAPQPQPPRRSFDLARRTRDRPPGGGQ